MMKALRFFTFWLALALSILASWQMAQAAPALTLTPTSGPPTKQVTASGTGFSAFEAVDLYFDTEDLCLGVTDETGAFSSTLKVPSAAPPRHPLDHRGGPQVGIRRPEVLHRPDQLDPIPLRPQAPGL